MKILRYDLVGGVVALPKGAQVLHVSSPNDQPSLFVRADGSRDLEQRTFEVIPVGGDVSAHRKYIGLISVSKRSFLVFEVLR